MERLETAGLALAVRSGFFPGLPPPAPLAFLLLLLSVGAPLPAAAQQAELCHKRDPAARIAGQLVEMVQDHWTLIDGKGIRYTVYQSEFQPCPPQAAAPAAAPEEAKRPAPEPAPAMQPLPCAAGFGELVLAGSLTVITAIEPMIRAFALARGATLKSGQEGGTKLRWHEVRSQDGCPLLRIVLHDEGSNNAVPMLLDRKAQIGLSARPFTDGEVDHLLRLGGRTSREEIERVVALDAILILISPANPVRTLALCDAARLFSGGIRDWRGVAGGAPGPVHPHARLAASGTAQMFRKLVLDACGAAMPASVPLHSSYAVLAAAVAADPGGIGFAPMFAKGKASAAAIAGRCGVAAAPTRFSVLSEDYPLARRLFVYVPFPLPERAQVFVDFLESAEAQAALDGTSVIGQTIGKESSRERLSQPPVREPDLEPDAAALANFRSQASERERLSITYRFKPGSTDLDSRAWQDIRRLVRFLAGEPPASVLLAGFSDAKGPQAENRRLARARADAVRRDLLNTGSPALARHEFQAEGYGEIFPVVCNETALGQERNRRVEVWVRSRTATAAAPRRAD